MSEAQKKARALLAYSTPGPWVSFQETKLSPNVYVVGCPGSTLIARVARSSEQYMVNPKRARPEHDAALIAAAPVLLAALCDENDALRDSLASVTAECARLRSDLDVEREQSAAFVKEIERLRVVEAGAAIMRRVLNEVGRHAEWAGAVRECLRDGAGSEFLARLVSAERDIDHARQELEFDRKSSAQAIDATHAEAEALRIERDVADRECDRLRAQVDADRQELTRLDAEVKRLKVLEAAELQRRAILDAMNGGER